MGLEYSSGSEACWGQSASYNARSLRKRESASRLAVRGSYKVPLLFFTL